MCVCFFLQLVEMSGPAQELAAQVEELCTGLKKLNASLGQKSQTVSGAQKVLKVSSVKYGYYTFSNMTFF